MNVKLYIDIGVTCADTYNEYMIEWNHNLMSVTLHLLSSVILPLTLSQYMMTFHSPKSKFM